MADQSSNRVVDMKISLGTILGILTALASVATWSISAAKSADQAGKDLVDMQARMERRFDKVDSRLDGIDGKTAVLPTQQERLTLLLKAHDDDMLRLTALDSRIGSLERLQVQTSTMLDNILRSTPTAVRIR